MLLTLKAQEDMLINRILHVHNKWCEIRHMIIAIRMHVTRSLTGKTRYAIVIVIHIQVCCTSGVPNVM